MDGIGVDDEKRSDKEQLGSGFDTKLDSIFAFLIGALAVLLHLKYKNKDDSVFDTDYKTMVSFIIALIIYGGAFAAIVNQNLANENSCVAIFLKRTVVISGTTACSLLVLVLVPAIGILLLIFVVLLSVFMVFKSLRDSTMMAAELVYHHILQVFFKSRTTSIEQPDVELEVIPV